MSSRSDPLRPAFVLRLARERFLRNMLSNQREDLDKAVLHFTESILLAPRLWLEYGTMILKALFFLALALLARSTESKQPDDAIYAAKYPRHLRDQPHQAFGFPRHAVTTLLVHALAFQVELEAGNVMENIEEMAVLCHELLTSDASEGVTANSVTILSDVIRSKFDLRELLQVPDQPLDQVIECLRVAGKRRPDLCEARLALARSLGYRYCMLFANHDYEEAVSILDEIITSTSPGDSQDKFLAEAQRFVAALATARSVTHEIPEYLEEAIYRTHACIGSSSVKEPFHSTSAFNLEGAANQRFRHFGSIEGVEESVAPVYREKYEDDDSEIGWTIKKVKLFEGLLSGIPNNDITKIDEAIEKGRTVLASFGPRDPLTSCFFELFGEVLWEAFERTNKIKYLNELISTRHQAFEYSLSPLFRFTILAQLSLSLVTRSESFPGHNTQDLDEGLELLSQCANDGHTSLPVRFQLASWWASVARRTQHSSVSTAYKSAVSLMQDALLFAPTLQLQHATLATAKVAHSLPLDYASYQVDLHQLEEAIVTLERGRALLWSEMRHLRASIHQLLQVDPELGHKFAVINRDLEELTKSVPPSHKLSMDDGAADNLRAADPFGRLLLKQRRLLKERDKLISQIQALPGFDSFLTSYSFDTLRSAGLSGPVIVINHSTWRSDILILLHNTSPSLISTPHDFYDRASALKDKLLDSREKYGLDSSNYDQTLASVLAELYELVGKPIIDRLRQLKVPEQSRIWWCPTSVFCSLPLHAMGPIPSDESQMRYFLDLYICSYTPTLSALVQSRNRDFSSPSSD